MFADRGLRNPATYLSRRWGPPHTSFAERSNLTMRMGNRRFTRLTNAFSKKAENHAHMVSLHMMYYNFVRIHQTLRCTPAMAAGVTKQLWELSDVVKVLAWISHTQDVHWG